MDVNIDNFLASKYVKFGRVLPGIDCWGLVRLARHHLFGRDLLPEHNTIDPQDKESLTDAAVALRDEKLFVEVQPRPGAIALAWRGRLCVHIGIVVNFDDRLWILETEENIGPVLTRCAVFERRFTKVIYYDN